jgi:hypothetical protein
VIWTQKRMLWSFKFDAHADERLVTIKLRVALYEHASQTPFADVKAPDQPYVRMAEDRYALSPAKKSEIPFIFSAPPANFFFRRDFHGNATPKSGEKTRRVKTHRDVYAKEGSSVEKIR